MCTLQPLRMHVSRNARPSSLCLVASHYEVGRCDVMLDCAHDLLNA